MSLSLRQADVKDLNQITQWTIQLHQHEDNGILKTRTDYQQAIEKWLRHDLSSGNALYLIAEFNHIDVGFISANTVMNDNGILNDPIKGVISTLWISPDFRKMGIAKKLVALTELTMKESGVHIIECTHTESNKDARFFWQSLGYQSSHITRIKQLSN